MEVDPRTSPGALHIDARLPVSLFSDLLYLKYEHVFIYFREWVGVCSVLRFWDLVLGKFSLGFCIW